MSHRGKRSLYYKQKRFVRRYVLAQAFRDVMVAETVCRTSPDEVTAMLCREFGAIDGFDRVIDDVMDELTCERGDVLTDARGRGTFQIVPEPEISNLKVVK